jgi:uncharacterized membrane protein
MPEPAKVTDISPRSTQIIGLALQVLAVRSLVFLALFMTVGLFAWAFTQDSIARFVAAASFGAIVFLPVFFRIIPRQKE